MKTNILKVTPEMAKNWLQKSKTRNRTLKGDRVDYYADQMKRGIWRLTGQGISFDSQMNIIDGQHRLSAIVKSNTSQDFLIISDIPYEHFVAYDDMKVRNVSDVFSIEFNTKNSSTKAGIINKFVMFSKSHRFDGISSINTKTTKSDVVDEYKKAPEIFDSVTLLAMRCYSKYRLFSKIEIGYISAHLIINLKYDFETVKDFFLQLHGIEPDEIITTKSFRERLIATAIERKKINTTYKILLLAKCWNNWIKGNELKCLKVAEGENPQFQ